MSEFLICPVCETENDLSATHCQVCGERLVEAAPGEEVPAEERVADLISAGEEQEFNLDAEAVSEGAGFDLDAEDELPEVAVELAPLDADESFGDDPASDELPELSIEGMGADEEPADDGIAVLYSTHDGTAYPEGTAEFEEGFGPFGEELVAELPPGFEVHPEVEVEGAAQWSESESGFEDEYGAEEPSDESDEEVEQEDELDEEPPAAVEDSLRRSGRFQAAFQARERTRPILAPLVEPGTFLEPATLTLYVNRKPVLEHAIDTDELLIGRRDPVADSYPEIDLTEWDSGTVVSRKHAHVYRQNRNYTLYVTSNAGTQLNRELLEIGDRRPLNDGDIIILAGTFALKFTLPNQ